MRPLRFTDVSTNCPGLPRASAFAHNYASFPVKRSWCPPFARVATQEGHHAHGDSAFFDLDEPAMGAKQLVARAGPVAQVPVLATGIYYSADGATHALHDLREWPEVRRNAAAARAAVEAPLEFSPTLPQEQQQAAKSNQAAMQRIAKTYRTNVYVNGICAGAQFLGCAFMGLGLAFDDVMLGSMLSAVVGYVETCMSTAVPNIVVYAAGITGIAMRDIVSNWGAASRLATHGTQFDVESLESKADHIVGRCVAGRQSVSTKAVVAGMALGIGVPLMFSIGAWGLVVMMPGALALPHILAQRHTAKLEPEDVNVGLNRGGLKDIANDLVHADQQASNIERHIVPERTSVWQRWGLAAPTFADPIGTATAYMRARLETTREHLSYVSANDADATTLRQTQASLHASDAALLGTQAQRDRYIFDEMVDALVDDGLFETFALEVAQSDTARDWLTTATEASERINLSRRIIKHLPAGGPDASLDHDGTLHRRTQEAAAIFLRVMQSAGLHGIEEQKDALVDLWLQRVA